MVTVVAITDGRENLRIRVHETINASLTEFCGRKKISKQDTIDGLLGWFLKQDGMLQSLVLGQVEEDYEGQVAKLVLDRWLEDAADDGGPSVVASTGLGEASQDAPARPAPPRPEQLGGGGRQKRSGRSK